MHLPDAVDAVVLLVKTLDLGDEEFVLQLPGGGRARLRRDTRAR